MHCRMAIFFEFKSLGFEVMSWKIIFILVISVPRMVFLFHP